MDNIEQTACSMHATVNPGSQFRVAIFCALTDHQALANRLPGTGGVCRLLALTNYNVGDEVSGQQ